ncbi:hypothetical protein JRQ81_014437 [Phrynocephalus forsythii]|uniref:Uncharacterized protein n=1 Tax=Phrynocephalus forsythii TaxID=171643 RepID=A0A9Q0XXC3_9SAUR|nr:hypothetical protein JRQ81_014437 [Phrynocephalus forsythii]
MSQDHGSSLQLALNPQRCPPPPNGCSPSRFLGRPGGCLSVTNGLEIPEPQAANSCHGNCRAHSCSETYKQLFSSFCVNGTHGIMSPLAKKMLLAQVSKNEALSCHRKHLSHCPAYKKTRKRDISGLDPETGTWLSSHCQKQAPKKVEVVEGVPSGSSQSAKGKEGPLKVLLKDNHHPPQKAEDLSSGGCTSMVPPVFSGSSYASRSDVPKPGSCHHPCGPMESSPALWDAPSLSLPSYLV